MNAPKVALPPSVSASVAATEPPAPPGVSVQSPIDWLSAQEFQHVLDCVVPFGAVKRRTSMPRA